MSTMRPQSARNSHTFVPSMKTTNGKCCRHGHRVIRGEEHRATQGQRHYAQCESESEIENRRCRRRRRRQRCLYWHSWGSPFRFSALCICVCQVHRIFEYSSHCWWSVCPLPLPLTPLCCTPFHSRSAIPFNALRIYRKMQYALCLSLSLSFSISLTPARIKCGQTKTASTKDTQPKPFVNGAKELTVGSQRGMTLLFIYIYIHI